MRILVTGGVRSGKSSHAESLIGDRPACYVAPGPMPEIESDPDWVARVDAHRERRPTAWTTAETQELAEVLETADRPLLIDCLGTWLTALIDSEHAWDWASQEALNLVVARTQDIAAALVACPHDVVVVTNEVGLGVVPAHRSGRLFRDLLGTVNQQVAAACDEVHLVIAGRVLKI